MFVVEVAKVITKITQDEPMTSGSQNVYVTQFEFSDEWDILTKVAVFRAGDTVINILLGEENRCMIPWEVLTTPNAVVDVGVFGTYEGNVVLPTIWKSMGALLEGVLTGIEGMEPTPDVYQQILSEYTDILAKINAGQIKGDKGDKGDQGDSAYQVAVDNGFEGTEEEWLASLKGDKGDKGDTGEKGDKGDTGDQGPQGDKGDTGASAYDIAVENGFEGTEEEWLASLKGDTGDSAYEIAVSVGYEGTEEEWVESLKGETGDAGVGVASIELTSGDGSPGTTDTYTVTLTNGDITTINVYNGRDGGTHFVVSDSLKLKNGVLSVSTPVKGFVTEEEFNNLSGEEKGRGFYVVTDENDEVTPVEGATSDDDSEDPGPSTGGSGGSLSWEDIEDKPDLSNVVKMDIPQATIPSSAWNQDKEATVTVNGVSGDESSQLITPVPSSSSFNTYYENDIKAVSQSEGSLTFRAGTVPSEAVTVHIYIQSLDKTEEVQE